MPRSMVTYLLNRIPGYPEREFCCVLNYMDKTKPFNFATTNMTTPGNWSTLLTNDENLSCALVY